MSEVFMAQRGQLNDRAKRDLRKAGVVVVEVDDLNAARFIRSTEVVSGDQMLWAAIDALKVNDGSFQTGEKQRAQFTANVIGMIETALAPKREP